MKGEDGINFDRRVANAIWHILSSSSYPLIITSHLEVFKSLQKILIKHITHEYIGKGKQLGFGAIA